MTLSDNWAPVVMGDAQLVVPSMPVVLGPTANDRSPMWWLDRLYKRLIDRIPMIEKFNDYYIGDHPLPFVPERMREGLKRNMRMTRTNYMGLVVDSMVERMVIEGFRIGADYEEELWRIYQANHLDAESPQAWLEAAKSGMAYMLVGPNPDDVKTPIISVEHPSQAIVEHAAGMRRKRVAGLKVWVDDWTAELAGELHLPETVCEFRGKASGGPKPQWRQISERPNPLKEVSLVELPNNPRLMVGGVSELADLTDIQDRINLTVAGRILVQRYGADPQKWATGYPSEDEDGNPQPLDVGIDRMVTSDVKETQFGQWQAAPLDPYSMAKKEDVKDIASRSRTPAQYLLSGDFSNVNGETLKASESGLVSKVRQRCRPHGEGVEDVMRMAAKLAGIPLQTPERMETIWRNPEFRTEGELVDALTKMATLRVPLDALWERWGATPQERERWREMLDAEAARELTAGMKAIQDADTPSVD